MSNALEALFGAGLLPATSFPANSRYYGFGTRSLTAADGSAITYLERRLCPDPARFATLSVSTVGAGERVDQVAARLIGDPEQYWALCDVNGAIWPQELETAGGSVRLTLPIDVPAPKDGG